METIDTTNSNTADKTRKDGVPSVTTGSTWVLDYDDVTALIHDSVTADGDGAFLDLTTDAVERYEPDIVSGAVDGSERVAIMLVEVCTRQFRASRAQGASGYTVAARFTVEAAEPTRVVVCSCPAEDTVEETLWDTAQKIADQEGISVGDVSEYDMLPEVAEATLIDVVVDAVFDIPAGGGRVPAVIAAAADEIAIICLLLGDETPSSVLLTPERCMVLRGDHA